MIGVRNLTDLLILAARAPRAADQIFVVSDGYPVSTPQMVRSLAEGLGVHPRLFNISPGLLALAGTVGGYRSELERLCGSLEVDASRVRDVLGWRPLHSTHHGLVEAGASFRAVREPSARASA